MIICTIIIGSQLLFLLKNNFIELIAYLCLKFKAELKPFVYAGVVISCTGPDLTRRTFETVRGRSAISLSSCWKAIEEIGRRAKESPKIQKEQLTGGVVVLLDDFERLAEAAFEGVEIGHLDFGSLFAAQIYRDMQKEDFDVNNVPLIAPSASRVSKEPFIWYLDFENEDDDNLEK